MVTSVPLDQLKSTANAVDLTERVSFGVQYPKKDSAIILKVEKIIQIVL